VLRSRSSACYTQVDGLGVPVRASNTTGVPVIVRRIISIQQHCSGLHALRSKVHSSGKTPSKREQQQGKLARNERSSQSFNELATDRCRLVRRFILECDRLECVDQPP
jgi:hypothetical protein